MFEVYVKFSAFGRSLVIGIRGGWPLEKPGAREGAGRKSPSKPPNATRVIGIRFALAPKSNRYQK